MRARFGFVAGLVAAAMIWSSGLVLAQTPLKVGVVSRTIFYLPAWTAEQQGFFKAFPPPGVQVVSWYVMMGIGQVVTLRVPADKLRDVNRAIENTAWGGYRTEFYPTYDYKAIGIGLHDKAQ